MAKLELPGLMQILEFVRIWLMKLAVLISGKFSLPLTVEQIYIGLILILAFFLASQVMRIIPMIKSGYIWVALIAAFVYLLKFY